MIYILSWTTKRHKKKNLSRPLRSKLRKIQGLFNDLHRNLRTFEGKMEFKDFSRTFQDYVNSVITLSRDGILKFTVCIFLCNC